MRAVGSRVLLRMLDLKKKTESGLFIPEKTLNANKNASEIGVVVNLGVMAYEDEIKLTGQSPIKPGDIVYLERYQGTYTKDANDVEYRYVWDSDVVGLADIEYVEKHYDMEKQ